MNIRQRLAGQVVDIDTTRGWMRITIELDIPGEGLVTHMRTGQAVELVTENARYRGQTDQL